MQAPAANPQQAGLVAASADMNAYSAAASFLCSPPMAQAFAHASAQSLTGSASNAIIWAAPGRDNDGTWSAGSPDRFTIATPGFYEVTAHAGIASTAAAAECWIQLTTGSGNPAGPGVVTSWWHGSGTAFAGSNLFIGSAGLIPVLIYATDVLQLMVQPANTCTTAQLFTLWGDWSHRLVSL